MIKKYLFTILSFWLLLFLSPHVFAEQNVLVDQADLFSNEQKTQIESELQQFHKKTGMTGVVVTTNNAEGKTSQDYADDFYDDNRYGTDKENSGFLLLLDLDNRKVYLSTTGKMIKLLSDRRIERILDQSVPYMGDQQYAKAATTAIQEIEHYYDRDQPGFTPLKIMIACAAGILTALAFFLFIQSRYHLKSGTYQYPYHDKGSVHLTDQSDIFITSFITTRRIPRNNNSGGGGGSSTHTSSGGSTHGGGGRSF